MKYSKDYFKNNNIYYLSEPDYQKVVGQLRLQIGAVLGSTFNMHGMEAYCPGATNAIVRLAEDFALRCRGVDKPIQSDYKRPY